MRAIQLLQRQLAGTNGLFHEIADDLTIAEWNARPVAGVNVLGFTLWHLPRTQDWAAQTVVRGVPEVIADSRWAGRGALATRGIGVGLTLAEADALARDVTPADVMAYADAIHDTLQAWLDTLSDDDLDVTPAFEEHQAALPEYQTHAFRSQTGDLAGKPLWRILTGPCIGHVRGHLGELGTLKQALRG